MTLSSKHNKFVKKYLKALDRLQTEVASAKKERGKRTRAKAATKIGKRRGTKSGKA